MAIAEEFVNKLKEMGLQAATAESCTGGLVASGIVDVEGASLVFQEGYITYSNRVKEKLLAVSPQTIAEHTVVSGEVAEEMAIGVHQKTGADITISVTGYAGPEPAGDGTPAGTVYIGTWYAGKSMAEKFLFSGNRRQVRESAAKEAYRLALKRIEDGE